jgi:hypothetical protein
MNCNVTMLSKKRQRLIKRGFKPLWNTETSTPYHVSFRCKEVRRFPSTWRFHLRNSSGQNARFKLLIKGLPEQPSIDRVVSLTPWGNAGFTLRMPKQSAYPVASCFITAYAVELIEEGKREPLPRLSENVTASL